MKRGEFLAAGAAGLLVPGPAQAAGAHLSSEAVAAAARLHEGRLGVFASPLDISAEPIVLHPDEVFPAASTIKVLIAAALMRAADANPAVLGATAGIRASDIVGGSPTFGTARPGHSYAVAALLRAMIAQSDNTASNALITMLGFGPINAVATDLALDRTRLARHFADDPPVWRVSENVTSPRDMGTFLIHLTRGARGEETPLASAAGCRRILRIMLAQEDRTGLPRGIPAGIPIANKTGELERVRNDIGAVDPFGRAPYVVAALAKNLNEPENGDAAIRRVSRMIYGALGS